MPGSFDEIRNDVLGISVGPKTLFVGATDTVCEIEADGELDSDGSGGTEGKIDADADKDADADSDADRAGVDVGVDGNVGAGMDARMVGVVETETGTEGCCTAKDGELLGNGKLGFVGATGQVKITFDENRIGGFNAITHVILAVVANFVNGLDFVGVSPAIK